jgi:hypothetical protein
VIIEEKQMLNKKEKNLVGNFLSYCFQKNEEKNLST